MERLPQPADLELSLRRADDGYSIDLRLSLPGSAAEEIFPSLGTARFDLQGLSRLSPDSTAYGQGLYAGLLGQPAVQAALQRAMESSHGLRLRLLVDPGAAELHGLHWEAMRRPDGSLLMGDQNLAFSRYLSSVEMRTVSLRQRGQMQALALVANPTNLDDYAGLSPLDVSAELQRARLGLGDIPLQSLPQGSLAALSLALSQQPVDILYIACHGALVDGEPYLWLEDNAGLAAVTPGKELGSLLGDLAQRPSLVVLASCQSAGASSAGDALAALGPLLARAGIPAVLAMQGRVSMQSIATFMPIFFSELGRHGRVDVAAAAGRAALNNLHPPAPDFWMPALFTRLKNGQIFRRAAALPDVPAPPEPARPPLTEGFVGRQAELAAYAARLQQEHLAVVTGMPGVGKTALAAVLARQSAPPDKIFWHSFHENEGLEAVLLDLAAFLAWHGQEELWTSLNRARQTSGRPMGREMIVAALLSALRGSDTLVCLDDLHHVDQDPLLEQFLTGLTAILDSKLRLIVISRRLPDLFERDEAPALQGLSLPDLGLLLTQRGVALHPFLGVELYARTEGNAELLMLALTLIQRSNQPEQVVKRLAEAERVDRYLMREVDAGLSEEERRTLGSLAVLSGYPAGRAAIQAVQAGANPRRALRELSDQHLLIVTPGEFDQNYRLHDLLQRFYYDLLDSPERLAMHRRASGYYESEQDLFLAALHAKRGGEAQRAAHLATGDVWALINEGRARPLRELLGQLEASQMEPLLWVRVCLGGGQVASLLGEREPARAAYQAALTALADQSGEAAQVLELQVCYGMGELLEFDDPPQALQWLQRGLALPVAEQHGAALLVKTGTIQDQLGNYPQALQALHAGLAHLPEAPSQLRSEALLGLGNVYRNLGEMQQAAITLQNALAISQELQDDYRTANILTSLGITVYMAGSTPSKGATESDWQAGITIFRQALALAERLGSAKVIASLELNLGGSLVNAGEHREALAHLRRCLEVSRSSHQGVIELLALFWIAELLNRRRKWRIAENWCCAALELGDRLEMRSMLIDAQRARAEAQLGQGLVAQALQTAQQAVALGRELQEEASLGDGLRTLGLCLLANAAPGAALEAFAESFALLEYQDEYLAALTRLAWGAALCKLDQVDTGLPLLRAADSVFKKLGARHDLLEVQGLLSSYSSENAGEQQ